MYVCVLAAVLCPHSILSTNLTHLEIYDPCLKALRDVYNYIPVTKCHRHNGNSEAEKSFIHKDTVIEAEQVFL